jgi:hypothetical protein
LSSHELVLYGDIHFRKWSWELQRNLIKDDRFAEQAGTIFMELGSDKQSVIDQFYSLDVINENLLLEVFQDYKFDGWDEKGKYMFLVDLWHVNQSLPQEKKIKLYFVDTPRPYRSIYSIDSLNSLSNAFDRNEYMAENVLRVMSQKTDNRAAFFTVGTSHITKSIDSSAGAIIREELGEAATYFVFLHSPQMDNSIDIPDRLHQGIFDRDFCKRGNKPLGFDISNSPVGTAPFDGLHGYETSGSYSDNYDGYIFLGSLDTEPEGEILFEIYTDDFIEELNRRYALRDSDVADWWEIEDGSKEGIIEYLKSTANVKRWEGIIEPIEGCEND